MNGKSGKKIRLEINNNSLVPKYKQIVDGIIESISQKTLKRGDVLPSVREVCKQYSLSQDTVVKAYNELKKRGIIKSVISKGYYVTSSSPEFKQKDSLEYVKVVDPPVKEKLEYWQDIKFGLLLHWGLYSEWEIAESWPLCSEDIPWCQRHIDDYNEYKQCYKDLKATFNPAEFDPEQWAHAAKAAGMKYIVFTTKHHDGFCMYDTHLTDFKITSDDCPFHSHPQADVTKAIFKAFRKEDFLIGAYFSKPDWNSEYYWWPYFATPDRHVNYDPAKYPKRWQKFKDFTYGQIKELMTGYGPIDILWLDGAWIRPLDNMPEDFKSWAQKLNYNQDIDMDRIVKMARKNQPGLIVVDRWVSGIHENIATHEIRIPGSALDYPWESCIPMADSWSFISHQPYKPLRELIHTLVEIISKGGNLLLNIGISPQGTWATHAFERLQGIGHWMEINAEAIYGTRSTEPHQVDNICFTRKKDGTLYAIYLIEEHEKNPPPHIKLQFIRPAPGAKISLLGVPGALKWESVDDGCLVFFDEAHQNAIPCEHAWTLKISSIVP
ncbi:alpha-L-fucosidase [candidate division KSB1 bacterium]|nr:alpha-L-fucosidase [candidate division KSB1 bacterium]